MGGGAESEAPREVNLVGESSFDYYLRPSVFTLRAAISRSKELILQGGAFFLLGTKVCLPKAVQTDRKAVVYSDQS